MAHDSLSDLCKALQQSEKLGYDQAWSMPKSYYTDPAVLELEREHLFGSEWVCIGRGEEVPKSGDYMTFQLCGEPLWRCAAMTARFGFCPMSAGIAAHCWPRGAATATASSVPITTGPTISKASSPGRRDPLQEGPTVAPLAPLQRWRHARDRPPAEIARQRRGFGATAGFRRRLLSVRPRRIPGPGRGFGFTAKALRGLPKTDSRCQ